MSDGTVNKVNYEVRKLILEESKVKSIFGL